jgi:hypothetical protein
MPRPVNSRIPMEAPSVKCSGATNSPPSVSTTCVPSVAPRRGAERDPRRRAAEVYTDEDRGDDADREKNEKRHTMIYSKALEIFF